MKTKNLPILLTLSLIGIALLIAFTGMAQADAPQKVSSVELISYEVNQAYASTELCIELPDKAQWLPYAEISFGKTKVSNTSMLLVDAKEPDILDRQNRCYVLSFPVPENLDMPEKATLSLLSMKADREGGFMSDAGILAIQKEVALKHPGVEFTTFNESGKGGGGGSIKFTALPEGVTEDQAMAWVMEASVVTVMGDWSIELDTNQ